MRFTLDELLQAGNHKWKKSEIDAVTLRNLEDLIRKVNALNYPDPMRASSCLRSMADQKKINPKAMGSSHLYGAAIDISDPTGNLARWLTINSQLLTYNGLWCEDPKYTKGWVHLSIYAPKSMKRFFIP